MAPGAFGGGLNPGLVNAGLNGGQVVGLNGGDVGGKAILWGGKENCLSFKYSGIFSCIFVMNAVYCIKMVIGTGFGQFELVTFVVKLGDIVC